MSDLPLVHDLRHLYLQVEIAYPESTDLDDIDVLMRLAREMVDLSQIHKVDVKCEWAGINLTVRYQQRDLVESFLVAQHKKCATVTV